MSSVARSEDCYLCEVRRVAGSAVFLLAGVLAATLGACAGIRAGGLEEKLDAGKAHGWVRSQRVDLVGIRVRLELATRCKSTPLLTADSSVLRKPQIDAAGCRSRPYDGDLSLYAVDRRGRQIPLSNPWPVREGVLSLRFDDLQRLADEQLGPQIESIELGASGWAGSVNLVGLRELLASWHLHWIARGRGSAALYVAAHPEAPGVEEVHALAVEAQLARQEADYLGVGRGELSPRAFLERHLWSPYRVSVRAMRAREFEPDLSESPSDNPQ